MANNFVTNLRATRGKSNTSVPDMPPTRGDIQKQRQSNTSVDPDSFFKFLRGALGIAQREVGKEPLNIEDVPPTNMDKMSPEEAEDRSIKSILNEASADNGTLRVENDLNKYNAAVNGSIDVPYGHLEFEDAYGVLDNYDKLNKILDDYDSINTWSGKKRFLKDAYKNFGNKSEDIGRWFNRLYDYTMEAQDSGEWDTKKVSDVMRQINDNVRNRLIKKI